MHNRFIAPGAMTVFPPQISSLPRTCGDEPTVFIRTTEEDCANAPAPRSRTTRLGGHQHNRARNSRSRRISCLK